MTNVKRTKSIYWAATAIIFLFDGIMPALTSNSELAIAGTRHLGYPDYFRTLLTVFKVTGAAVLILPFINSRIKEWAYAGFAFTMISAFISLWVVDGLNIQTFFPLFILAILGVSYIAYHQYRRLERRQRTTVEAQQAVLSSALQ